MHHPVRTSPALLVTVLAFVMIAATPARLVFTGYKDQNPGVTHKITVGDLPQPYATKSVDNGPHQVERPKGAWPQAPAGFKVELFAENIGEASLGHAAVQRHLAAFKATNHA